MATCGNILLHTRTEYMLHTSTYTYYIIHLCTVNSFNGLLASLLGSVTLLSSYPFNLIKSIKHAYLADYLLTASVYLSTSIVFDKAICISYIYTSIAFYRCQLVHNIYSIINYHHLSFMRSSAQRALPLPALQI